MSTIIEVEQFVNKTITNSRKKSGFYSKNHRFNLLSLNDQDESLKKIIGENVDRNSQRSALHKNFIEKLVAYNNVFLRFLILLYFPR